MGVGLLAWASGAAGLLLLQRPWAGDRRRSAGGRREALLVGWALVGGSVALWCGSAGWSLGLAYAAIALAPTAWALTALAADPTRAQRTGPRPAAASTAARTGAAAAAGLLALRVAAALPLAGAAVLGVALLLLARWGAVAGNGLTLVLLVAAPVWAAVAVWAVADRLAWRPALVLAVLAAASLTALLGAAA